MYRPGRAPVTARLIAEHGPDADGWWPARELHPAHGRAAVGYRVRGRKRRTAVIGQHPVGWALGWLGLAVTRTGPDEDRRRDFWRDAVSRQGLALATNSIICGIVIIGVVVRDGWAL